MMIGEAMPPAQDVMGHEQYYTTMETARITGMPISSIRGQIKRGHIAVRRIGYMNAIPRSEVRRLLIEQEKRRAVVGRV